MGLIWADFPSGQRGLYGTNRDRMLNGVWAQVFDGPNNDGVALVADPDPAIGAAGVVMKVYGTALFPGVMGGRFAYPLPQQTQGLGVRLWLPALPANNDYTAVIAFKDNTNTTRIALRVLTNGQIEARSTDGNGGTFYGVTPEPVVGANAWNHLEMKVLSHAAAGTIELRVNGFPKLTLAALNTNGAAIAQVHIGTNCGFSQPASIQPHYKDLVLWDTTGAQVNNFQGSVGVYDLVTDGDVAMGDWNASTGANGYPLLADNFPASTLTASGAIIDGETVRIDNTYYRFTNAGALDAGAPAGTAGNPWRVLIGGSVAATLLNLFKAIGATGAAGVDYSTALVAHATVNANGFTATAVSVTAKIVTASAIVTAETGANLAWVAGTLIDGPTDPSYIWADNLDLTAARFTMSNLPPDVISVKGVIPIGRMVKTDGGDCNVKIDVSPDDVNWTAGTDRPITVASTFWWDVSHLSPASGGAWTPAEVNSMRIRIDRTL